MYVIAKLKENGGFDSVVILQNPEKVKETYNKIWEPNRLIVVKYFPIFLLNIAENKRLSDFWEEGKPVNPCSL